MNNQKKIKKIKKNPKKSKNLKKSKNTKKGGGFSLQNLGNQVSNLTSNLGNQVSNLTSNLGNLFNNTIDKKKEENLKKTIGEIEKNTRVFELNKLKEENLKNRINQINDNTRKYKANISQQTHGGKKRKTKLKKSKK